MRRDQLEHAIRTSCHLAAGREKDVIFVTSLLEHNIVTIDVLLARADEIDPADTRRQVVVEWCRAQTIDQPGGGARGGS